MKKQSDLHERTKIETELEAARASLLDAETQLRIWPAKQKLEMIAKAVAGKNATGEKLDDAYEGFRRELEKLNQRAVEAFRVYDELFKKVRSIRTEVPFRRDGSRQQAHERFPELARAMATKGVERHQDASFVDICRPEVVPAKLERTPTFGSNSWITIEEVNSIGLPPFVRAKHFRVHGFGPARAWVSPDWSFVVGSEALCGVDILVGLDAIGVLSIPDVEGSDVTIILEAGIAQYRGVAADEVNPSVHPPMRIVRSVCQDTSGNSFPEGRVFTTPGITVLGELSSYARMRIEAGALLMPGDVFLAGCYFEVRTTNGFVDLAPSNQAGVFMHAPVVTFYHPQ